MYIIFVIAVYWVYFRPVAVANVTSFSSACYFRFQYTRFCFHQAKVNFPSNLKPNTSVQNLAVKLQPDYLSSPAPEHQRNYGGWQGTKWMLPWLLLLHFSVLSISNHSLCFHLAHSYNLWDKKLYFNKWQKLTCTYLFGWNLFYVQFYTVVRQYGVSHAKF